jgi:hypothetical protein
MQISTIFQYMILFLIHILRNITRILENSILNAWKFLWYHIKVYWDQKKTAFILSHKLFEVIFYEKVSENFKAFVDDDPVKEFYD